MGYSEYNDKCFAKSNLNEYLKETQGEGTTVVVFDGGNYPNGYDHLPFESPHLKDKHVDSSHAGKVLAVGHAIAPKCKVVMFRFYDSTGYDWVIKNKDKIDAINISMGISENDSTYKDILKLKDTGIPIFISAGNEGSEEKLSIPSGLHSFTYAIGAANHTDNTVYYSNRSKNLDILGYTNIDVIHKDGDIVYFTGTSCASPFACFSTMLMVSLLKKRGKKVPDSSGIRKILHDNATDIRELGFDTASGYGIIKLPKIDELMKLVGGNAIQKPNDPIKDQEVNTMKFRDVNKNNWYYEGVKYAVDTGLMTGISETEFAPNKPLTRAEFATVLMRMNRK